VLVAFQLACGDDTVKPPLIDRVEVDPAEAEIVIGGAAQLTPRAFLSDGSLTPAIFTWSSSDPTVATVDPTGLVTGITEGIAQISGTTAGLSALSVITVVDPSPPTAPGSLSAVTLSHEWIEVSWTDLSDDEDYFRVEREDGGGWSIIATPGTGPKPPATSLVDTDLTPDTEYRYRVSSCNRFGCSNPTGPVSARTDETLTVVTDSLPWGVLDTAYEVRLEAAGGDGTFQWEIVDGGLPEGMGLSADGLLSGMPADWGDFSFRLEVTTRGQQASRVFQLTVLERHPPPVISTDALPDGVVGEVYAATMEAEGGDGTYRWSIVAGDLPDGLTLEDGGSLSGDPTLAGAFTFSVEVLSAQQADTASLTVRIWDPVSVAVDSLPEATTGEAYSFQLDAQGGTGVYSWALADGELPPGMELDGASGTLTGTPGQSGEWRFTVEASSLFLTGSAALALVVRDPLTILSEALMEGVQGIAYSDTLRASGGLPPYRWSLVGGSLPLALSLEEATGAVQGMPVQLGEFEPTVRVIDASGRWAERVVRVAILTSQDPLRVITERLAPGLEGFPFSGQLESRGGAFLARSWELTAGDLPPGLDLATTGEISGVPLASGEFSFTVTVWSGPESASADLAIRVSQEDVGAYNVTPIVLQEPGPRIGTLLDQAIARWEGVIVGDLPAVTISPDFFGPLECRGKAEFLNGNSLDDLAILLDIGPMDGPGGLLGSAGPCGIRGSVLPFAGILRLDSEDLDALTDRQVFDVIVHELAHILGFGTLWEHPANALLEGPRTEDPRYLGARGILEYQGLGGADPTVPVENTGGTGTRDGHWRESVFDTELMTGYAEAVPMPLSAMSIGAMGDLGYVVDLTRADEYTIPPPAAPGMGIGRIEGTLGYDEIYRGPIVVLMPDGSRRVLPARR
jgi:hypothetical protein